MLKEWAFKRRLKRFWVGLTIAATAFSASQALAKQSARTQRLEKQAEIIHQRLQSKGASCTAAELSSLAKAYIKVLKSIKNDMIDEARLGNYSEMRWQFENYKRFYKALEGEKGLTDEVITDLQRLKALLKSVERHLKHRKLKEQGVVMTGKVPSGTYNFKGKNFTLVVTVKDIGDKIIMDYKLWGTPLTEREWGAASKGQPNVIAVLIRKHLADKIGLDDLLKAPRKNRV